jgi:hypothetical protein
MAGGILYLEIDDEITSAAGRIRRAEGSRVAVVLPYGSRVATSRINFRLLARDALTHEKRLSIVAPDGATRALAASAGLPVFASVAEYEASLEEPPRPADAAGSGGAGAVAAAEGVPAAGAAAAAAAAAAADAGSAGAVKPPAKPRRTKRPAPAAAPLWTADAEPLAATPAAPPTAPDSPTEIVRVPPPRDPVASRPIPPDPRPATSIPVFGSRRASIPRTPVLVGAAILALAVLVTGVGAYALLPAATVAVTPHEQIVGPLRFSVADETVTEPDAARRVVPAERLTLEVTATDSFPATGKRVEQTRATGRVTFQSLDTGGTNRIPSGSIVSTEGGIQFKTLRSVTLARAEIVPPLSVRPSSASVDVEAVKQGPSGNVPANSITVIPRNENPAITRVRNANETTGGSREEFPRVDQEDVDKALEALRGQLATAFEARLADPAIVPEHTTIFPGTAVLGEPAPTEDVAALVDTEVEQFELGLTASGSVVAVDPAPVAVIAETLLLDEIEPGFELVADSTSINPGAAVVEGQTVSFPVVAEARQVRVPDPAELEALILGKPLEDARAALAPYGDVEVSLWPDWVTSVPTIDARVEVEVRSPIPLDQPPATLPPASDPPDASPSTGPQPSAS